MSVKSKMILCDIKARGGHFVCTPLKKVSTKLLEDCVDQFYDFLFFPENPGSILSYSAFVGKIDKQGKLIVNDFLINNTTK